MLIEMKRNLPARRVQSIDRLTPRERQAAELTTMRNGDIATAMGISTGTVKVLLLRAMEKAGAETRTQLYALVMERRAA
jgi:DNA-binding CsgD family transcriptional regulator